jgi:competence protein ComEC
LGKRPLAQTVIAYAGGILFALCNAWYIPLGILILFVWMNIERMKNRKYMSMMALLAACVVLFGVGIYQTQALQSYRAKYADCLEKEMPAVLQGKVYKKETKNDQYLIYLTNVVLRVNNQNYSTNQVLIYLDADQYRIGKTIVVKGKIKKFKEAVNEGGFDQQAYYQSLKVDYKFEIEKLLGTYGTVSVWKEKISKIEDKLKQNYTKMTNEKYASIFGTMILGDKNALDPDTKVLYQHAGISHILVISGLHISMLGMGLFGLLRKCKGSLNSSVILAGVLLLFYAQLTGWGVSTLRAVAMFGLAMIAKCLGKTYDRITALAIAVLLILMENPFLITSAGFQLSVGAIVGIILAGEQADTWRVSGMIQLVTIPLLLFSFYEIPIWSLLVNMIILPLSGCLLVSGLVSAIVGSVWIWIGRIAIIPACLILWFYEKVCQLVERMPVSMLVMGHPSKGQLITYYVLLLLGVRYFDKIRLQVDLKWNEENKEKRKKKLEKQWDNLCMKWNNKLRKSCLSLRMYGIHRLVWLVCIFLLLFVRLPHQTRIDVLDVGQGDGICVQLSSGQNFFVDGGSSDVSKVGQYRILPYLKYNGIGQIDCWFVSHLDTDHVSGLIEALENSYPVKQVIIASSAVKNENWDKLKVAAKKNQTQITHMKPGDKIQSKGASIQYLFPQNDYPVDNINARSMVLLFQEKEFRGILVGDITSKEEDWLLKNTKVSDVTWYKASHHGSKYSNSSEWLNQLSPQISTISYGAKNRYGHPGKEAVGHMKEAGSQIFHTAQEGQISIILTGEGMKIRNYRNPLEVIYYPVLE